uniref:Metastriate one of each protein family n=1 Tax=Rhipicephalus appendiculatus TaxID=34631 RepID=A0A131YT48_RHIAP
MQIGVAMKAVGALLLIATMVSAEVTAKFGECTFPGLDLEVALDEFLQRLPASYEIPDSGTERLLPGLSFGNTTLLGLSTLAMRGAPRPFCRKGVPMLEVSLSTRAALRFIAPWRYCSALSGKLSTTSSYVTLNVLFEVSEDKLVPVDVWLTWLEGTYVLLDGAPDALSIAVAMLSKLAPAVVRDFWVEETAWRSSAVFKAVATSGKN